MKIPKLLIVAITLMLISVEIKAIKNKIISVCEGIQTKLNE